MAADATVRLQLDTSGFQAGISKASALMGGLGSSLGRIGAIASPMIGIASAALGVAGAFGIMAKSISSAASMEGLQSEFSVMLGSMKKAQDMTKEINQFASATPFSTEGLAQNVKTMLAFGQSGDSVLPTLKMLGDVAGSSQEKLDSLTLAFSQISASGKLQGQDLLQLVNAGFNPLQEISRTTGESMASLRKKMEGGAISADMVSAAFKSATSEGGRFFQNTETQSKTWNGLMSTLGDNVNMAFAAFGTPVMDSLKPLLKSLVDYTAGLASKAAEFGGSVANAFLLVQQAFSGGQLGEIISLSLQVGFAKAVNFLIAAFRGLVAMLMSSFETAPGRLMAGLMALFDPNLWTGLGEIMTSIGQGFLATLSSGLAPIIDKLLSILAKLGINVGFSADDFVGSVKDEAAKNWTNGVARMGSALAPVGQKFSDDSGAAMAEFQKAFAASPGLLDESEAGSKLAGLWQKLQEAVDAKKPPALSEQAAGSAPAAGESSGLRKLVTTSLASMGLGGYTSGGANPELGESRKQTDLQRQMAAGIQALVQKSGSSSVNYVPVFGNVA